MKDIRIYIIRGVLITVALCYVARLFYVQIINDSYKEQAKRSKSIERVKYPYRGAIYDRNGHAMVYSTPIFDLMITWKDAEVKDTTRFCELLGINKEYLLQWSAEFKEEREFQYRKIKPQVFLKRISAEKFAQLQDSFNFKGFSFQSRMERGYPHENAANILGYIAEISRRELEKDSAKYYRQGDFLGKSGIEASYEQFLRGKKGTEFIRVNAKGVEIGAYDNGKSDTAAVSGVNLQCTIDIDLQAYGELLMQNKVGSIVAIEPSTGEVLALVSSPTFDPNLLRGEDYSKNYKMLEADKRFTPLFNRAIQAQYPPGSTFKVIQGLIALQEKAILPGQFISTVGEEIGDHAPDGMYDVAKGIRLSSNKFFKRLMRRVVEAGRSRNKFEDAALGLNKWKEHMESFGLGHKLGIDIYNEEGGLIPGAKYYNKTYGEKRWRYSTIYSLSIGQGEVLITPLQLANLAVIMANRGYYRTPHLIRGMHKWEKNFTSVDQKYFEYAIDGMEGVVYNGTAGRAQIPDVVVCGKTGTVENKKIGDKTYAKDHSVFMAFAPREDPKIAISVYVENSGNYGGTWAAPIASLMMEKYIKGKVDVDDPMRRFKEQRILEADFMPDEEHEIKAQSVPKPKKKPVKKPHTEETRPRIPLINIDPDHQNILQTE